jgi:hypothetical protein
MSGAGTFKVMKTWVVHAGSHAPIHVAAENKRVADEYARAHFTPDGLNVPDLLMLCHPSVHVVQEYKDRGKEKS